MKFTLPLLVAFNILIGQTALSNSNALDCETPPVISGSLQSCIGELVELSINDDNFTFVQWTINNEVVSQSLNCSQIFELAGTYEIIVHAENANCIYDESAMVTIIAPPTIIGPSEVCGLVVAMFSTPDNSFPIINWYFEDVFIASASEVPMSFAMPGDYNIILEVGDENCTTTSSILVTAYEVPTVEIFNMDNTLFTQVIADSYQWYLDGNPIEGATESVYNPTEPGVYSLFVFFESGCENGSNAINFNVGIEEINNSTFSAYPNPFQQTINLNATAEVALPLQIEIYDMIGNKVYSNISYQTNIQLEISTLTTGAYLCRISDAEGNTNSRIIEKK
jgi:hypothetical protein